MCGICGKISYGPEPIKETLINDMCGSFAYRGPDDNGIYTHSGAGQNGNRVNIGLGHQRLSIIDLSSAGQQPMSNEDGTVWVTFNGEIYNFKEIRAELKKKGHLFRSDTDTEVMLHLYEEENLDAVQRLNGMFAFALWDENINRLWVCRDRIGIKPLVYYWSDNNFVFASEIKALLNDPLISRDLDHDALRLYLAFNYVPAPYTIFEGIRKLKPGQYLVLQNHKLDLIEYWDTPRTADSGKPAAPSPSPPWASARAAARSGGSPPPRAGPRSRRRTSPSARGGTSPRRGPSAGRRGRADPPVGSCDSRA